MIDPVIELHNPESKLVSFISSVASLFSNPFIQLEESLKEALSIIGDHMGLDQVEGVIKSSDKGQKLIVNWCANSSSVPSTGILNESDLISFLFKNQREELFFMTNIGQQMPAQIKKILQIKGLKSVVILRLRYGKKKLGYITFGLYESRQFSDQEIGLIKTFGTMFANCIVNENQSMMIKRLVGKNREQDRRIKEFTFITSHHLRAFSSNLTSLTEYLLINPNEQRFIEMISNSVKRLNGSIRDINDILTEENDLLTEEIGRVKISRVINKVLEWHKRPIDANEIEIENHLPGRLTIYSQLEMLENIFSHIISNAIKYGTSQTSKIIRIDHAKNEDYLIIRIRDFGQGINMKKYGDKLFKAGSRFNSKSNSSLGMGLFLSKYQVQKIGGRIHMKSEPGKGTSVQCYLPNGRTL